MHRNNRFSKTEEEFMAFYHTEMVKDLQEIEELRKRESMKAIKHVLWMLGGIAFIVALMILFPSAAPFLGVPLSVGPVIYIYLFVLKGKKLVSGEVKRLLMPKLVTFMNESFTYYPDQHISKEDYYHANIFSKKPSKFYGDDLVTGKVGRTQVTFSELHTFYLDSDGDSTKEVPIFEGLFFSVDFNKHIPGFVSAIPKQSPVKWVDRMATRSFSNLEKLNLQQVEVEHVAFHESFGVLATDQMLARYVLHASFMEKLLHFSSNRLGKTYFSFRDGHMYLAVSTEGTHFDFQFLKPMTIDTIKQYYYDLITVLELVDDLHLNIRIWDKK